MVKVERDIKTKQLKKDEEKLLVGRIKQGLGIGRIAEEITLMVTNISGIIQGKFGTNRIANFKVMKNKTNSLNLYRNMMEW